RSSEAGLRPLRPSRRRGLVQSVRSRLAVRLFTRCAVEKAAAEHKGTLMIALLDYGAGNVGSVLKAVRYLGHEAEVVGRTQQLRGAAKLIFPGQGHFGAMMRGLAERRMLRPLRDFIAAGKPFLGICLGLQALYEASDEAPGVPGLALLPGRVARFQGVFKVPHVGWSQLEIPLSVGVLEGISDGSF